MATERIGIFGGTFDPVHNGHIGIARIALDIAGLDRIIFVPAFQAPHRAIHPSASPFHRFAMLALAVQSEPRFAISDVELEQWQKVYTVDTLGKLRTELGASSILFFILGSDSLREMPTWKDYPRLLELCRFVVFTRKIATLEDFARDLPETLSSEIEIVSPGKAVEVNGKAGTGRIHCIRNEYSDVSSSMVRQRIHEGGEVRSLVPESVFLHIRKHGLYQPVPVSKIETETSDDID
jgi:nicotinate-nucleotide adenylyltransferase